MSLEEVEIVVLDEVERLAVVADEGYYEDSVVVAKAEGLALAEIAVKDPFEDHRSA